MPIVVVPKEGPTVPFPEGKYFLLLSLADSHKALHRFFLEL